MENAAAYEGYVITSAPEHDRLLLKSGFDQKYVTPEELGLRYFEALPLDHPVWKTCSRDIVRFVWYDDNGVPHLVGSSNFLLWPLANSLGFRGTLPCI